MSGVGSCDFSAARACPTATVVRTVRPTSKKIRWLPSRIAPAEVSERINNRVAFGRWVHFGPVSLLNSTQMPHLTCFLYPKECSGRSTGFDGKMGTGKVANFYLNAKGRVCRPQLFSRGAPPEHGGGNKPLDAPTNYSADTNKSSPNNA